MECKDRSTSAPKLIERKEDMICEGRVSNRVMLVQSSARG